MKLRFEVNQAEAFRAGIDCPQSVVSIDTDPTKLDEATRLAIAERMLGIDVYNLENTATVAESDGTGFIIRTAPVAVRKTRRLVASSPDFDGMMEAIRINQADLEKAITNAKK